jgi:hypothetical protein
MPKNIVVYSDGTGQDGGARPEQRISGITAMLWIDFRAIDIQNEFSWKEGEFFDDYQPKENFDDPPSIRLALPRYVGFTPQSRHRLSRLPCPFCAKKRHRALNFKMKEAANSGSLKL